jgi:hypothetical protein
MHDPTVIFRKIGAVGFAEASKRGPAPKLAQHMEKISQLPRAQQQFVMRMLDTALAQQGRQT